MTHEVESIQSKRKCMTELDFPENQYMKLKQLGPKVGKFSNVTLGKDDVQYYLIGTNDITPDGIIELSKPEASIKEKGSSKGVLKYMLKKGDIVFPHSSRLKSIGVMTGEQAIPYVGHHGLIRISCGENNLEMAFLIRDYLQLSDTKKYIFDESSKNKSKITIETLENLPIPMMEDNICDYQKPSMDISKIIRMLNKLKTELALKREILMQNAFSGDYNKNSKIEKDLEEILSTLEKI